MRAAALYHGILLSHDHPQSVRLRRVLSHITDELKESHRPLVKAVVYRSGKSLKVTSVIEPDSYCVAVIDALMMAVLVNYSTTDTFFWLSLLERWSSVTLIACWDGWSPTSSLMDYTAICHR